MLFGILILLNPLKFSLYFSQPGDRCRLVNMYYKIIESFGPNDGDKWLSYLEWRGLNLTRFDSVDGILRPDLFQPECNEDWRNCVNENYKLSLITNLTYAKSVLERYNNPVLVGVEIEIEKGYIPKDGILGFDIIDGYCNVSLITNWGTDEECLYIGDVMTNGLIGDLGRALKIRDLLRKDFSEDSHAENCSVWAIYKVDTKHI
ncbi:MAG: hypothetical protein AB4426_28885 [Xenococcaceae cyanobacterium]